MIGIKDCLVRQGNEIIAKNWAHGNDRIDFIVRDTEDDALAFITCSVTENDGDGFPEEDLNRDSLERVAIAYLASNLDNTDCMVRFDCLNMLVIGESRALIRHHKGAMSRELV